MIQNIRKGLSYFKRNGFGPAVSKAMERLSEEQSQKDYENWLVSHLPDEADLKRQQNKKFQHSVRFSIIVPAYRTAAPFLRQMIQSVLDQSYADWELCIADGSEEDTTVQQTVAEFQDSRIRYLKLPKNLGIAGNTNAAFQMADGDYIGLLDHDDLLTPNALYEAAAVLETDPSIEMIYSDEDKVSGDGRRYFTPNWKPDYDPEYLRTNNYICHFLIVERGLAGKVGYFRSDFDGAQDYDFILRCSEQAGKIIHIPKILYHWRSHQESTAENPESKRYAYEAGKRALEAHLKRKKENGEVSHTRHLGYYRIRYEEKSGNDKDVLLHMAEDAKILTEDWKSELFSNCLRPEVGIVGGKSLRRGRVQQAGYTLQPDGSYTENFQGLRKGYSGYMHRAAVQRCVDAVSSECFAVRKDVLQEAGYPENFEVSQPEMFQLCERIRKAGYLVVYTPYVCIETSAPGGETK